ncbi:MAG: response regulator [Prevotella sp.]|nr:response regulator [Prevotella sp.]
MNLTTVIILVSVLLIGLFAFIGRSLYRRSVRIRNQLQMSYVFTNITHELLTPLTIIDASVERLRKKAPDNRHDYDLMELNIARVVRLLQQILETSKSQAGELRLRVSHGDVMRYIRETALCIEPLMAKKGLEFTIRCKPESMMGWIDTDKLDKIIFNLLSNAAKYTGKEGKVIVDVATNSRYDKIIIRVSDNGTGIPHEKMKRLFTRFYDGEYRKNATFGTGIGLALARDLIYLHRGTIQCESFEGQGTTFIIELPIKKNAFSSSQIDESHQINPEHPHSNIIDLETNVESAQEEDTLEDLSQDEADENAYTLLIVEDNVELLMLMKQLLQQHYHILTASNGVEALQVIQAHDIDLIVSDVMMPEMDGNELTTRIKQNPDYSHLPIILLTAKTQEEDRNESLQLGADDYVTKPFRLGDLQVRINNIIANRRRIRRLFLQQSTEENIEQVKATAPSADNEFLERAIRCLDDHISDSDYDRDAFARDMGASASTLYNKLRAVTGMNVSGFIRNHRIKTACRMAQENPSLRVSDIAYRVGFKDPKYFATSFKKEMGIQPSEYFEQLRG